ncbi:hypothetical protein ACFL0Z_01900 [Patescibacteria group bacterium]
MKYGNLVLIVAFVILSCGCLYLAWEANFYRNQNNQLILNHQRELAVLGEQIDAREVKITDVYRQISDTSLSYRNVRNFCWDAREVLDCGSPQYALDSFRKILDYQFTEADAEFWLRDERINMPGVSYAEAAAQIEKSSIHRAIKAYMLAEAVGLALQLHHQCGNWEPLYQVVSWSLGNAPEAFDISHSDPTPEGVYVLNHDIHRCLFVLSESEREGDRMLVARVLSEIPVSQPLFVAIGGWDCPEIVTNDLLKISHLPPYLCKQAKQRALVEWNLLQQHVVYEPQLLDDPVRFDIQKTHREVLQEVLDIKV